MIARTITKKFNNRLRQQESCCCYWTKTSGKNNVNTKNSRTQKTLFLNGDDPQTRLQLVNANFQFLMQMVMDYETIVIDEAQRIENIGLTIKMLLDAKLNKQFILTGSSSLDLGNQINEPLTGKKMGASIISLSWSEIKIIIPFLMHLVD